MARQKKKSAAQSRLLAKARAIYKNESQTLAGWRRAQKKAKAALKGSGDGKKKGKGGAKSCHTSTGKGCKVPKGMKVGLKHARKRGGKYFVKAKKPGGHGYYMRQVKAASVKAARKKH